MKIGIGALVSNMKEGIEFCKNNSIISHMEIGVDSLSDCDELRKYAQELIEMGLTIGIHLPLEVNTCEDIEMIRHKWVHFVKQIFKETSYLSPKYYNLHLGYGLKSSLNRDRIKYLRNTVEFLDDLYDEKQINLTIENTYTKNGEVCSIGTRVEDFEYIFEHTKNNNVKFCYDTGHDLINRSNYFKLWNKFKVVHLSDNDGSIDQHLGISNGQLSEYMIRKALSSNGEYIVLEMQLMYVKDSTETLKEMCF